jgi:hypothetical protein
LVAASKFVSKNPFCTWSVGLCDGY